MQDTPLAQLDALAATAPLAFIKRELQATAHKLRFPMTEILAKVPGASVAERARKLGVSRQTIYVWMTERYRPTPPQAKRIAKLTGIPIEQIVDDGFDPEARHDTRRKARTKAAKVAGRRKTAKARHHADGKPARKRSGAGDARKVRKRAGGGPDGAE